MKRRLVIVLFLIVVAPLAAVAYLGMQFAQEERALVQGQVETLLEARLVDTDAALSRFLERRMQQLRQATLATPDDLVSLRARTRETPWVRQFFVAGADGLLLFPPADATLTQLERDFLERTRQLWTAGDLFVRPPEGPGGIDATLLSPPSEQSSQAATSAVGSTTGGPAPSRREAAAGGGRVDEGWYVWYWRNGLNLIYWRRDAAGRIVGAELDRVRLLADVVAELPSTDDTEASLADSRVALVDARGAAVYQWGRHEPMDGEPPRVEVALSAPLGAWKLRYFMSATGFESALGGGALVGLAAGLGALAVALVLLASYFYRESSREMQEAAQRVSFVSQVSHELKTPLTNIRMYAELLEPRIDAGDARSSRHLGIIVSESQRLSRLIGNVLTFSRHRRGVLRLRPATGCVDDVVASVLEQFAPSLLQKGVQVELSRGAPASVQLDGDALEQIVGNLISNVEKYAAQGGRLEVQTSQEGDRSTISVQDFGPGIPASQAERVFEPFYRLEDRISEGVSGTGIGLSLARQLARLHGGDLCLEPSELGASWRVSLRTPTKGPADEGSRS